MGDRYRHRRPRYYDDDESDTSEVDNYPPPKPRGHRSDIPPPPAPHPSDRDLPPAPAGMPPPPQQQVRRPSILVDPDETPSERAARRDRPRSASNVRLQTSDDEYERKRSSRRAPEPRHDLEAKNGEDHRRFRQKRDGYESDEGENLRRATARKAAPGTRERQRPYPDDGEEFGRPLRQERTLPMRGKPREPIADGVEYGGAAVRSGGDGGAIRRARTYKEPSTRDRQGYDDYDPSPRRSDRRRPEYDDPGYRSDNIRRGPSRRDPPRRREYDDYDSYDRAPQPRRREDPYRSAGGDRRPRPQDYYSDHREDRAPRRGDPRRVPRDDRDRYYDRYDDRRYDDRGPPRDPRDRRKSQGGGGWQKEAGAAIMAYAMPTIKKEGTKWAKKELSKFLAARGAGGA